MNRKFTNVTNKKLQLSYDRRETGNTEGILLEFLISKKWQWHRHLLMLITLAVIFYPGINATDLKKIAIPEPDTIIKTLNSAGIAFYLISVMLIYCNLFLLIPKLLLQGKYLYYLVSYIGLAVIYYLCEYFISRFFLEDLSKYFPTFEFSVKTFVDSTFIPLIFLSATAGYKIFKKWIIDTKLLAEMKEAKIQEELTNLKNQINPHFLFNTLNNLNTLIDTNPKKASAVVLGLSDVLRYQLYEATSTKVSLKKDIEILKQVLELEKIRRDNFQFNVSIQGNINAVMVPPFIFINFVENAIKHSADNKNFSYISLDFCINTEELLFICKNSVSPSLITKNTGGIGLQNIKRRLELLYPVSFILDIEHNEKEFSVNLTLPL